MKTDSKEDPIGTAAKNNNKTTTTGSSRLWSGLKDPRIVRVSRAFGGKDRHSKVTTIRGLRDRRVRLSVPTAIQLYDLQDKLGLSQPSKVVDWLLNAAQHEIDKLPPLEFPAVNFLQFHQHSEASSKAKNIHQDQNYLNLSGEPQIEGFDALYQDVGIQEPLVPNSRAGSQALGFLSSNSMPYGSYYHWDSSNRNGFSQFGRLSSHVLEAAPASALSYNYYMTAPPCDLDGSSPQQNHSLHNNTAFRNTFHSGIPKARPF